MVKLAAAAQMANATNPAGFLNGQNGILLGNTQRQFVTAAYVYLNAEKGELHYSAADHTAMLLLQNGEVIRVVENGLMLASWSAYQLYRCFNFSGAIIALVSRLAYMSSVECE
jgi:phosphoserine phosphatase RsbU/P